MIAETRRTLEAMRAGRKPTASPQFLAAVRSLPPSGTQSSAPMSLTDAERKYCRKSGRSEADYLGQKQRDADRANQPAAHVDARTLALRGEIHRVWPQRSEAEIDRLVAEMTDSPDGPQAA
jgi:hypothetical protein